MSVPISAPDSVHQKKMARKAAFASLAGGALEFYDYFIFGTAAALVFGELFFPGSSPLVGTLSAFAAFGVGFLARPLGGIVLGSMGDRLGRKKVLVLTMMLMGGATILIGLLPTAGTIGWLAPILLVLLRMVQGFGVGGEWGGAALIAVEHAPANKRGRFGSVAQMGVGVGAALASGAFALVQLLTTDEQFMAWGWRIPFLASIVLIGLGMWIRWSLDETPEFEKLKETDSVSEAPVRETFDGSNRRGLFTALGMRISENVIGYIVLTFSITYVATQVDANADYMPTGIMVATLGGCVVYYLSAWASDVFGRRKVFIAGGIFAVMYAFPFFWLLDTGNPMLAALGLFLAWGCASGIQFGIQPAYFPELFGKNVRYTGISMGYQIGAVFGGGFAPFIATALLAVGGGSPIYVILYIIACALVSLVSAYFAEDPYGKWLRNRQAPAKAGAVSGVR